MIPVGLRSGGGNRGIQANGNPGRSTVDATRGKGTASTDTGGIPASFLGEWQALGKASRISRDVHAIGGRMVVEKCPILTNLQVLMPCVNVRVEIWRRW